MVEGLFQPTHLIIILAIALLIFGPGKLANVGGSLGKSIREFKVSSTDPQPNAPRADVSGPALLLASGMPADFQKKAVASDPANV